MTNKNEKALWEAIKVLLESAKPLEKSFIKEGIHYGMFGIYGYQLDLLQELLKEEEIEKELS
jgi:hypothetical protein